MKKKSTILAMFFIVLVIDQTDILANSMIYWTDFSTKKIQRSNLDGSGVTTLVTTGLGTLHDIALDTAGGKMYWTDSGLDSIQRANLDGSHIEPLVTTGLSAPIGIALDVSAGKMYWTDSLTHKIQRANLNGSGVEDLVTTGLQWPRTIALDIARGKMYWTDGGTAKIQRANLDGSGVEDLVTAGSGALQGIALDISAGKMYWADLIKIQRANLDGSSVEFLVTTGGRLRGIALDVGAGKMYWTDSLDDKIQRANLDGSGVEDLVTTGLDYPIGIALDVPIPKHAIFFVDSDAPPLGDGSSWAKAFKRLKDALFFAQSGDEIRVAQGVYKPAGYIPPPPPPLPPGSWSSEQAALPAIDRMATFQLKNGVVIKGGYAGLGQADPNTRDIDVYETVLSGDLLGNDGPDFANNGENSYHVVTGSGTDKTAVLEGFTVTAGNADGNLPNGLGGGMYNISATATIKSCTFRGNAATYGGGMYNEYSNPTLIDCDFSQNLANYAGGGMHNTFSSPTLDNCTFSENEASDYGGGMYNSASGPTLTNCSFYGNSATLSGAGYGGGMFNGESTTMMTNCLFSGNSASRGGGMYNVHGTPRLTNCTVTENSAEYGGGMYNLRCNPTLTNCILWANIPDSICVWMATPVITYSNVQGSWPGAGNINADPCFVDPVYLDPNGTPIEGDYHLQPDSPCINAGDPNHPYDPNETDLDGNPRVTGGRIDMGAYEFQNTVPVADAGTDQIVECACNTAEGTKVTLDGTGSFDADGDALTYTWTGPFVESPVNGAAPTITLDGGCPGEYVITLVVNDGTDDSEPNEVVITVVDTTPPEFALSVSPTTLWPPNHEMVLITPAWTVSDECDSALEVSLVSISINEGDTKGDGHTDDDVQINDDGSIYLRAERSGTGGDRVYTIIYRAVDDCGNVTESSANVTVPHDRH